MAGKTGKNLETEKSMRIRVRLIAPIIVSACLAAGSTAQEASKEDTIAWLQDKIGRGSIGCTFEVKQKFDRHDTSYLQNHRYSLERIAASSAFALVVEKDITKTTVQRLSGDSTSLTESSSQRMEFSPSQMIESAVTLIPQTEVAVGSIGHQKSSCHAVSIGLYPADGSAGNIGDFDQVVVLVNDWSLAMRMKSAFEHLAKLEQSSAAEPF